MGADAGHEVVLPDGRPALIEDWFDVDTQLDLRTFFYSAIDIENWSEADHLALLARTGKLKGFNDHYKGAGVKKLFDASGNEMWSISVVKNPDEDEESWMTEWFREQKKKRDAE